MTLLILFLAGVAYTIWRIQAAINTSPTHNPHPSPLDHADTCQAPLCTNPATIRVHANHDYVRLCIGHGLPLLTEGMRA